MLLLTYQQRTSYQLQRQLHQKQKASHHLNEQLFHQYRKDISATGSALSARTTSHQLQDQLYQKRRTFASYRDSFINNKDISPATYMAYI
jgi:hypothetical protein